MPTARSFSTTTGRRWPSSPMASSALPSATEAHAEVLAMSFCVITYLSYGRNAAVSPSASSIADERVVKCERKEYAFLATQHT